MRNDVKRSVGYTLNRSANQIGLIGALRRLNGMFGANVVNCNLHILKGLSCAATIQ
jgi:hypothetical protein